MDVGLRVSTTKAGPLRVRVFDVNGRLLGTLIDDDTAPPGTREAKLRGVAGHLPSGVVFFEAQTGEGVRRGKLVIVK